jgi:hypothetical protein
MDAAEQNQSIPDPSQPATAGERSAEPPPSGLMFWVLIGLAAVAFIPCIVLPIWRDYQAAVLEARLEEQKVAVLQADVDRQRRVLEAIRTAPAVSVRLAQRELGYRQPGQQHVLVAGEVPSALEGEPIVQPVSATVEPPEPIARLVAPLPEMRYDQVFCEPPTRTVIMLLSGGLMVAAFVLYPRQGGPPVSP